MAQARAEVQIIIAQSAEVTALGCIGILQRLGPEAQVEAYSSAQACIDRCAKGDVDLIVVDDALGEAECGKVLEALSPDGPPVIVLNRKSSERFSLEVFRLGAADCVAVGAEFREVLPVVAQEQIRRWRVARERLSAERRISDLERYNKNIIQNLNSALLVVDNSGKIAICNPLAEDVFGTKMADLCGRLLWDWFPGVPRDEIPVARTLATGERLKGYESSVTRLDGTVIPIGVSCAPVVDGLGKKIGAVAVFSDLTEIKQLQNQVLQTEKMASIGQLAAGVAHEINNPMGFIHANLFQMAEYIPDLRRAWDAVLTLQQVVAGGDAAEIGRAAAELAAISEEVDVEFLLSDLGKAIRESQEGSERIRHIVHDLREFSHQDAEQRVMADINQCLDSTATIVWPMMKHLVILEKNYQDLPKVRCYPMQLKQVFMNLLVNAFQAIEEHFGESGKTGAITLRTYSREGCVAIEVSDNGAGIEAEHLDRIFDPFFTTKKVGTGTGLGLSTCFNIVERHGGNLRVESKPGVETCFTLLLPCEITHVGSPDAD